VVVTAAVDEDACAAVDDVVFVNDEIDGRDMLFKIDI
jgi:hypothetical protein